MIRKETSSNNNDDVPRNEDSMIAESIMKHIKEDNSQKGAVVVHVRKMGGGSLKSNGSAINFLSRAKGQGVVGLLYKNGDVDVMFVNLSAQQTDTHFSCQKLHNPFDFYNCYTDNSFPEQKLSKDPAQLLCVFTVFYRRVFQKPLLETEANTYFDAFCSHRQEPRKFRLDCLTAVVAITGFAKTPSLFKDLDKDTDPRLHLLQKQYGGQIDCGAPVMIVYEGGSYHGAREVRVQNIVHKAPNKEKLQKENKKEKDQDKDMEDSPRPRKRTFHSSSSSSNNNNKNDFHMEMKKSKEIPVF